LDGFPSSQNQIVSKIQMSHITPEPSGERDEALLLQYHQRFGHVSFKRLKMMEKAKILPSRLAKAREQPACAACMPACLFAKATRRACL